MLMGTKKEILMSDRIKAISDQLIGFFNDEVVNPRESSTMMDTHLINHHHHNCKQNTIKFVNSCNIHIIYRIYVNTSILIYCIYT
jgi:hypothetical protein